MKNQGEVFVNLLHLATSNGIIVKFAPLKASYGRIKGNRLAIRQDLSTLEEVTII